MNPTATLSSEYQISIPKAIRAAQHWEAGVTSDAEAARQPQIAPGEAARSRSRIAAQLGLKQAQDWRRYVQAHGLG